jgi:hypothetical protein
MTWTFACLRRRRDPADCGTTSDAVGSTPPPQGPDPNQQTSLPSARDRDGSNPIRVRPPHVSMHFRYGQADFLKRPCQGSITRRTCPPLRRIWAPLLLSGCFIRNTGCMFLLATGPSLFSPLRSSLTLPPIDSLGAAFGPFYRLTGPFAAPNQMSEIVETELWETITRRGLAGNLFMGIVSLVAPSPCSKPGLLTVFGSQIPMAFYGMLNATAWVLELLWLALGRPFVAETRTNSGKVKMA